jgi:predicted SAM-dependent methyltransferase
VKLYLGSREYRPEGFLSVDIDPQHSPDIVADVAEMPQIASCSIDEICASHILEHLAWPRSFLALAEWARILRVGGLLKIAVPDLAALAALIAKSKNPWSSVGIIFGVGRLENQLEAHQYGYTSAMLSQLLDALGFANFSWWKHDLADASNGWMLEEDGHKIALSLNIQGTKVAAPLVDPHALYLRLADSRLRPFDQVLDEMLLESREVPRVLNENPLFVQRLHMALIEARMRIRYLEEQAARPDRG